LCSDVRAKGNVEIGIHDGIGAVEFFGGDARDSQRMPVEFDVLSEDIFIASESFLLI
jgi:hypothetical protein